jgi:hypothetical protein
MYTAPFTYNPKQIAEQTIPKTKKIPLAVSIDI